MRRDTLEFEYAIYLYSSAVCDFDDVLIPSLACCGMLGIDSLGVHVPAVHRTAETVQTAQTCFAPNWGFSAVISVTS